MDFKSLIHNNDNYNFHTHTQFCDGHDTMEAIAAAAVDVGMTVVGFSPHSPVPIVSPCNMMEKSVDAFTRELSRIADIYEGRCKFLRGMEIDYLDATSGPSSSRYADYGLDYSIGSVHFIKDKRGEFIDIDGRFESFARKMHEFFNDDIRYVVEKFYETSEDMLSRGGFDILGHFDKIGQNASYFCPGIEDEYWYQDLVDRYIDNIIKSDVIVEINTKALVEHHRFFPGKRYWKRLLNGGVSLIVNSDAHYASKINAGRPEALSILRTLSQTPQLS